MLKFEVPEDKAKIKKQIAALEYQIKNDTNDKDKTIHVAALNDLKRALEGEK